MKTIIRLALVMAIAALSYAQPQPVNASDDPCEKSEPIPGVECKKCDYYPDPWGCFGASCCVKGTDDCIFWGGCEN